MLLLLIINIFMRFKLHMHSVMETDRTCIFFFAEKLCPDNCTSQSRGICNTSSGYCNCKDDFGGASCAIKVSSDAECKSDLDCPEDKICNPQGKNSQGTYEPIKTKCENPCDNRYNCGYGAECEVKDRKAICTCIGSIWIRTENPDPYVVSLISKQ